MIGVMRINRKEYILVMNNKFVKVTENEFINIENVMMKETVDLQIKEVDKY